MKENINLQNIRKRTKIDRSLYLFSLGSKIFSVIGIKTLFSFSDSVWISIRLNFFFDYIFFFKLVINK